MKPPLAEIRDLRVEVDGRAIVDGVSLRVPPGTVTALVGASGSGKTTTGLALLGEYPAGAEVSGEVTLSAKGLVGYIPQHPSTALNPARRVSALLMDIARPQVRDLPRGERRVAARSRVLRAMAEAQLADGEALLRRYPHQLSGGQQQRVVLAQALLLGARVIVADEPTTGQDALTKDRIVGQLRSLTARGIAVVLLSHDLDVVRALADEVLVMRAGRVVESGPAERVWTAPRHAWTRELLEPQPASPAPEASSAEPVLRLRGLRASHQKAVALRTPELDLRAGECLAVVGRSGSGKTTLARCVAGLHRTYEGEITLDGTALPRSLRDRDRSQLAAVQYVFQDARAAFDEHRPVLRQVARTAVRLHGVARPEAESEALATLTGLGLPAELVRRRPGELSGGELQRVALARALLARPRVLLCDEITSGLDTVTRRDILATLMDLLRTRRDLSLLLITHDLETAALAHRVVVLDAGEVVEQGRTTDVLAHPSHPLTTALLKTTEHLRPLC
ncbi:ATP-binding cassette domain-containing protein [Streptomyces sp. SID2999]|uniref:ABC transporter ATP-binding protein n=1 Tax=Streptomyces sp. SID2999 TaxID=2690258 RepID=UPI0031B9C5FA